MNTTTSGIDIAKTVFQLHGTDSHGKVALEKRLRRNQLLSYIQQLPPCRVGMEAANNRVGPAQPIDIATIYYAKSLFFRLRARFSRAKWPF